MNRVEVFPFAQVLRPGPVRPPAVNAGAQAAPAPAATRAVGPQVDPPAHRVSYGARWAGRARPPPVYVTPPSPPPRPIVFASPSRHVAAQAYAALGCYALSFAASTLGADRGGVQVLAVGATGLVACVAAAASTRAGWVGWGRETPWLLATGATQAAVLGAALGPLVCAARHAGPQEPAAAFACPPPAEQTATFVAASGAASLLWAAACCARWRAAAGQLRGGMGATRAPSNALHLPLATAAAVGTLLGLSALGVGLAADDAGFTGVGCLLVFLAPALATPALAAASPRPPA